MKTVLYLAMSVNGMIAGENDEAPWSNTIWDAYVKTVEHFGNIIVGHKTFEIMKKGGDFNSFIVKPFCVVMSHHPIKEEGVVVTTNPAEAIKLVRQKGFSKSLIGGGSLTAKSFLTANLVDEIHLDVESILMGKGLSLLDETDVEIHLSLQQAKQLDDKVVHLEYLVERDLV